MPHSRDCEPLLESPFLKLSQSFPSMSLSLALEQVKMDLNNSCFGAICGEKGAVVDDDELQPLSWLQNTDLLKDIYLDDDDDDFDEEDDENSKENFDARDPHGYNSYSYNDGPMDPKRHINSKPPFSFSCLIFMAIEDSSYKRLPVKDIYHWIEEHFPFYQTAPTGWKNSVRHNLSLNKCFRKVEKLRGQQALCKGSLWCVDPDYRPNLLQALRKTPFHPYHHVLPFAPHGLPGGPLASISYNPANRLPTILSAYGNGVPIPAHILLVEKLLNGLTIHHQPFINGYSGPDMVEADAAATMMMFKVPPEQRDEHLRRLKEKGLVIENGMVNTNGAAPAQAKPQQPHMKPTLADLAETALSDYRKPKHPSTPQSKAALKAKCTPSPNGCDDHTYSLSTKIQTGSELGSDDDPVECDVSDVSEDSFNDSESESEDAVGSPSFNDSGVFSQGKFKRELEKDPIKLPLKKRLKKAEKGEQPQEEERELAEGADALLNLAGIKTEVKKSRSSTPNGKSLSLDHLSPVCR